MGDDINFVEQTEGGSTPSIDFSEDIRAMASDYNEYMHAQQILSTIPPSTLRRYRIHKSNHPRLFKREQELLHQLVAVSHMYNSEACRCTQGGADFGSALMAVAAVECLSISDFIVNKKRMNSSKTFNKLWRDYWSKPRKKLNPTEKYAEFIVTLRLQDVLRIAREMGFYSEQACPPLVVETLRFRGYSGNSALADFINDARNCIHVKRCVIANERYAKYLDVMYRLDAIKLFHTDFALCAWELHGQVYSKTVRTKSESLGEDRLQ
jgi:hypothetical protein